VSHNETVSDKTKPLTSGPTAPETRPRSRWRRLWQVLILTLFAAIVWNYERIWAGATNWAARSALKSRDADRALKWLSMGGWLAPKNAEAAFLQARACRRLGEMQKVRECLELALHRGLDPRRIEREQWLAYAQTGQMHEAEPHIQELLSAPGDEASEICEAFVNGYYRLYQYAKAEPMLDAWQADLPSDPRPHEFRGIWYSFQRAWQDAIQSNRRALELDPGLGEVRLRLAEAYFQVHDYDAAEREFRAVLSKTPRSTEAQARLADVHLARGEKDAAEVLYNDVLAEQSLHEGAVTGKVQLEMDRSDYTAALAVLEPAVEAHPLNRRLQYMLGVCLKNLGRIQEAGPHLQFADESDAAMSRRTLLLDLIEKEPYNVELRYEFADLTRRYVSEDEGLRWLIAILQIDPTHQKTRDALKTLTGTKHPQPQG
jgi:tetratricopeptide (TPR) repeat protein